jgi:putative ABC transport system substrate-binding protein
MRRREFVTLLGGAAAWPVAAHAQQPKLPTIGILVPSNPEPFWSEFRAGLRTHGYIEGHNIQFEFRSADGKPDRLRALADELVRLKVDIIAARFTPAVTAARHATSDIPIVMAWAGDPIGTGLISSLARPGGNITGLSGAVTLWAKCVELIRDALPATRRVAFLANATDPFARSAIQQVELGGRALGIATQILLVRGVEEFDTAFAAMATEQADAVLVQPSLPLKPAIDLALKQRLPSISTIRLFSSEGGLISYSVHESDMYRRAADYVDRILKGAKPADLPVEQPTRFELIVNLKTAKALGLTAPPTLLARADEVIE